MSGFFSKLFGVGKSKKSEESPLEELINRVMAELIEKSGLDLSFSLKSESPSEDGRDGLILVELSGADEEILKDRRGQVLDAIQLFLKRVVQHNFSKDRTNIEVDCGQYRQDSNQALIERADSLKAIVLEQGKSVYYRALPPKERKVVHQYLAQDPRIKSRSLGDGMYKKIKIYPAKGGPGSRDSEVALDED